MADYDGDSRNNYFSGSNASERIRGFGGNDTLKGNGGKDTIEGGDGCDSLSGGSGDDLIYAGRGTDRVDGGSGDDTIIGGGDGDCLYGGADADTIIIDSAGEDCNGLTYVDGGSCGDDEDRLDLRPLLSQGFQITQIDKTPENHGQPGFDGQIKLFNDETGQHAKIKFKDIEKLVICFTPGTAIATPTGEVAVEDLREGDRVFTRDNGVQTIRWTGRKQLDRAALSAEPTLRPVLIRAGALGHGLPERDMMVSPCHRMLIQSERAAMYFDEREVLAAAKHLTEMDGISRALPESVSYHHILFDHHEVILANGAWSESFQPGDHSLRGVGAAQRAEIVGLFPELGTEEGIESYASARRTLRRHEARILVANQ